MPCGAPARGVDSSPAFTGRCGMARIVRCGLIQAQCEWSPEKFSLTEIKKKMIAKHEHLIADAAKQKVQVLGLQELFYGPYFCAEQQTRWYELTERVPSGPTVTAMQKLAKKYQMVLVVPVYEVEMTGVYFNTAAVIDADGRYLGKYRKHHIPTVTRAFGRSSISRRETPATPSSRLAMPASACTSATTAISRKARASSGSTARKSSTTLPPPSPVSPNICGNWSNPLTRLLTPISSPPSTASAPSIPGKSANSTARAISAIHAGKS